MKKIFLTLLLLFSVGLSSILPAEARYHRYYDYNGGGSYHPYLEKALIGGGIGAVAGGLLGTRDPVGAGVKGALLGSAAGLGYEYLRRGSYGGGYNRGYNRGYSRGYNGCGRPRGYRTAYGYGGGRPGFAYGRYNNPGYYGRGYGGYRGYHHGHGRHRGWN